MKDWMLRAGKTFVQAFLGVLIPEVVLLLESGTPLSGNAVRAALMPVISAALAAAISAVWNLMLEAERRKEK